MDFGASLAATTAAGAYGLLAARSESNDAMAVLQTLIVCGLLAGASVWRESLSRVGKSDERTRDQRLFKASVVCVVVAFVATATVAVRGRLAVYPNKWDIRDDDQVEFYTLSAVVADSLTVSGVSNTLIQPPTNATHVLQSVYRRAPWTVLATAPFDAKSLRALENAMHDFGAKDVVVCKEGFAVRRKAVLPTSGDVDSWCPTGLLRCAYVQD